MKIFFASIGNPTAFIARRIQALKNENIEVLVDWDVTPPSLMGEQILEVAFKKPSWKRFYHLFFFPHFFLESFKFLRKQCHYSWKNSFRKALFLCEIARHKPHLVHVQWTNAARDFLPLQTLLGIPVLAAVRGTQLTTSPFISENSKRILDQILKSITHFQTVSLDLKDLLVKLGVDSRNIIQNYNGVNTDLFKNFNSRSKHIEQLEIIMVARNYWSKCVESAFFMLHELKKKQIPFRFTWVGVPPNDPLFKHWMDRLDLTHQVQLIDRLNSTELVQRYNESDVILSTSAAEGLANVILEAMATGCIPVVWKCEGMNEAIGKDGIGFIHAFGEISSMVSSLESIYMNNEWRLRSSKACEERVVQHFNEKIHTGLMIQEYQNLLRLNQRK
jgi:glycosyltransferase involved in cell wall biosynthesis